MTLPFFNPGLLSDEREALLKAVQEVATDPEQKFILGRRTAEMEARIRERTGVRDVIACASGSGALTLALRALGVGPGDEVIVPAFGSEPLAGAVVAVGATPVFGDVDPETMVLDPVDAERLVTERTRVVMPAHAFTVMADMPAFVELAARHGLALLEDSAFGQGATLGGRPAGTWGDVGLYSFFPVKPLGMPGEGAVVLTDDEETGRKVRSLRNHGQDGINRFLHHTVGFNSRFDEVQAGFQLARLLSFDTLLEQRMQLVEGYDTAFAPLRGRGVVARPPGRDGRCGYVYAVQAADRDGLRAHLARQGIGSYVHYPVPLPRLPAFADLAPAGRDWPGAAQASARHLALPLWPGMTGAEAARVIDAVRRFAD
jgi:dTDP-4-amino-4,6-dideoxygalactose transaminase